MRRIRPPVAAGLEGKGPVYAGYALPDNAIVTAAAASPASKPWLHGPASDLLLGCGGFYTAAFLALPFLRGTASELGLYPLLPVVALPIITLLVSVPHYGGTLLRVYEQREERRRYAFFTVYVTLFLCAWFVAGVYDALLGSWMVTLYLTWSPWHYSGQNYGLALMFLRRSGVSPSPLAKRALWASFVLSFALTALLIHEVASGGSSTASPGTLVEFVPIGLSRSFVGAVLPVVLVLYAGSVVLAGWLLVRAGSPARVAPAALLVLTQAVWFVIPFGGFHLGLLPTTDSGADVGAGYITKSLLWAAMAHAAQYLWVTSYYARHASAWRGYGPYFGKVLLAGALVWTFPLVVAPAAFHISPFVAGLPLLVAALVNLHHFVLDGAIWKLRGGPVASILIRSHAQEPAPVQVRRTSWKPLVWGAAALCLVLQGTMVLAGQSGFQLAVARGHTDLADSILAGVGWLGEDTAVKRMQLGHALRQQGQRARALAQFRRALEIAPDSPFAHRSIGEMLGEQGRVAEAADEYRRALELDPSSAELHLRLGVALARLERPAEAVDSLRTAVTIDPAMPMAHVQLANALLRTHRVDEAIEHLRRALALQPDLAVASQQLQAALDWQQRSRRAAAFDVAPEG